eukprot:26400_1
MASLQPTHDTNDEFNRYCLDMVDHDILHSMEDSTHSTEADDNKEFDIYCLDMVNNHNIYNLQFISSLISNAPCYLLFDLLQSYFTESLPDHAQNKLENGFISNGINGTSLQFIDKRCLNEMNITDIKDQCTILNAINQIFLIFNTSYNFTYHILYKYLRHKIPKHSRKKLKAALKLHKINGEALMFINHLWLKKIGIIGSHRNDILNAIHDIFNYETFSTYISTYPFLARYQHLFIQYKIDLNTFKNNYDSAKFYHLIGITNRYIIHQFKKLFPISFKRIVKCCNCEEIIILSDKLYKFYKVNKIFRNTFSPSVYRLVYGEYMRIFCQLCTYYDLHICEINGCQNNDVYEVCLNHTECEACKHRKITKNCVICSLQFCSACLFSFVAHEHNDECASCINKQEINSLKQIISNKFWWDNIVHVLAEYSVGAILICCNTKCNTEIVFDNKLQFYLKKDYNDDEIYYYEPTYFRDNSPTVKMNKHHIRIFCATCTIKSIYYCGNCCCKDIDEYCLRHQICTQCKTAVPVNSKNCSQCQNIFCANCLIITEIEYICEECSVKNEQEELFKSLSNTILETMFNWSIIRLLTEFCSGYILQCCNRDYIKCDDMIIFNNVFQFERKLDCNENPIYYYEAKYPKPNKPTISIDNRQLRMFCNTCTLSNIQTCIWCKTNKESGNGTCCNHPLCKDCSSEMWDELFCKDCKQPLCHKCFVQHGYGKRCQPCVHKIKISQFAIGIYFALPKSLFMVNDDGNYISKIIASYGIGYIVKCCNVNGCESDSIIFNNHLQILLGKDYKNNSIYCYKARYFDESRPTILINESRLRVFCNFCTFNVIRKCHKYQCNKNDLPNLCAMHPLCSKCNKLINNYHTCQVCDKVYCKDCSICMNDKLYCESCTVKEEKQTISEAIFSTVKHFDIDIHIIDIITDYYIGYIFKCCNVDDGCNEIIIFNNIFQFQLFYKQKPSIHAYNVKKIYYYSVKYSMKNKPTITNPAMKNEKLRIFCAECAFSKISFCRKCWKNKESGYTVCCNHAQCGSCFTVLSLNTFCSRCNEYFCMNCLYNDYSTCKSCAPDIELNQLTDIIFTALKAFKIFEFSNWKHISFIVAEYSIGFVFKCCNLQCNKVIVFDNTMQFDLRTDFKNRKIKCYEPEYFTSGRVTITLSNKRFRIFCYECSHNKIKRCTVCGRRDDITSVCGKHPICSNCNATISRNGTIKCCICLESYCESCCYSLGYDDDIIYCKICIKQIGYDELYGVIYDLLKELGLGFDIHIIGIIMDYSIGYAFECGNTEANCANDIVFENMFQFRQKHDFNKTKIYYYEAKHIRNNKPAISIDNKKYRIFCGYCTNMYIKGSIKKCELCRRVSVYDIGHFVRKKESGKVARCCDHPECAKCNVIRPIHDAARCRGCLNYFCYQKSKKCCVEINSKKYCEKCGMSKEFNDLVEVIANSELVTSNISNAVIIEISKVVAQYSIGFIFICCKRKCKNKVIIDNIWQFGQSVNCENEQIMYRYISRDYVRQHKKVKIMNNKALIILCTDCTTMCRYIGNNGRLFTRK